MKLFLLIIYGLFALVTMQILFEGTGDIFSNLLRLTILIAIAGFFARAHFKKAKEQEAARVIAARRNAEFVSSSERKINAIINKHLKTLATKHQQTITQDSYGVMEVTGWENEIKYFIEKVIWPEVSDYLCGTDDGRSLDAIQAELDKLNLPDAGKTPQEVIDKLKAEIELIKQKNKERMSETAILINNHVTKYRASEIES